MRKLLYLSLLFLTACSTTRNLPEDETLYTGYEENSGGELVMLRRLVMRLLKKCTLHWPFLPIMLFLEVRL